MQENWVDFKAVKAAVTMEMVLGHYQVHWLRKSGEELRGRCPIHEGEGANAFHVNTVKNAFHCFSCKARGNVLDFVAAMEKCSVRAAALKLGEWFTITANAVPVAPPKREAVKDEPVGERGAVTNKPLGFELKGIDFEHPYLAARGLSPETVRTFGVGYFSGRGSMKGRVVIPIHDERGALVGYAGRSIDESEPRYKLPAGFHKSQVLYNLHRVTAEEVIVVEGFFDCMKVWQSLNPFVVALMGSRLSEAQERLLRERFKRVTLLLDGDEPGRKAAEEIAGRLVRWQYVRIVEPSGGKQADELIDEELQALLK